MPPGYRRQSDQHNQYLVEKQYSAGQRSTTITEPARKDQRQVAGHYKALLEQQYDQRRYAHMQQQ